MPPGTPAGQEVLTSVCWERCSCGPQGWVRSGSAASGTHQLLATAQHISPWAWFCKQESQSHLEQGSSGEQPLDSPASAFGPVRRYLRQVSVVAGSGSPSALGQLWER